MAMDLVNSDIRYSVSQLSVEQRFQLLTSFGDEDDDYSTLLKDILQHSLQESRNINATGFNADHPLVDQSQDDNVLCLVEKSENEAFYVENEAFNAENEVFNPENEAFYAKNYAFNPETEVLDYDDPLYKLFLSHVKGNGRSFTFETIDENGFRKTIQYDKEKPILKNRNKDSVEEDIIFEMFDNPVPPDLKEKLMAILRKPFDEQEHDTLWHEVTQRRYKLRHRELPDGTERSVRTKIKAKSYIQKHKAFRRAIKAVSEDKFKRLNILRGFSFWLQYLPGEGTFKPWKDASCLAVMPGSH